MTTVPEQARNLIMPRGQFRVSFLVPQVQGLDEEGNTIEVSEQLIREEMRGIPWEDEHKRVYIYKVSVKPDVEEVDGESAARITAVFHVVDNPLPLVPIVYGLAIMGSAAGGWFLIDKVQEFTESSIGNLLILGAAVVTLVGGYKLLSK